MAEYEMVIGLEVHCQLSTRTKLFCGCRNAAGADPNTHTCPVCLGHPGVLPVMNATALRYAVTVGEALGCKIRERSIFARKNYFYPDLPKGYQISQFDQPICEGGALEIECESEKEPKRIGLTRIHLEEDAGKTVHLTEKNASHVDFNRCGVPLIEIVSEPELRTSDQAAEYLKELRNIVRYLGVCDGNMEAGNFRCDANVSIRPKGREAFGTRVELKNLNSFNHVKRAIDYEASRQQAVLESNAEVIQETRLWDEAKGMTRSMRSKEEAHDYRYFPEPDLGPLMVPEGLQEAIRSSLPELPAARRTRYTDVLGISPYDARVLTADKSLGDYFEAVVATGADPKPAANWVQGELQGRLKAAGQEISDCPVNPAALGLILSRVASGRISGKLAKKVFGIHWEGVPIGEALDEVGEQVTDTGAIAKEVSQVLGAHPKEVEAYRAGKKKVIGFFIGEIMKATRGKANPQVVRQALLAELDTK